jgi:hypothetical protein
MKITKRYTETIKLSDGSIRTFATELQSDELTISSAEDLITASDKAFAQVKWLVERDKETVFGTGA